MTFCLFRCTLAELRRAVRMNEAKMGILFCFIGENPAACRSKPR